MAQILLKTPAGRELAYTLNGGHVSIGRGPDNVIVLDDESVSAKHAELVPEGDAYLVRDLGSSNGTKVNGQQITEHSLCDGDNLQFGPIDCIFQRTSNIKNGPTILNPGAVARRKQRFRIFSFGLIGVTLTFILWSHVYRSFRRNNLKDIPKAQFERIQSPEHRNELLKKAYAFAETETSDVSSKEIEEIVDEAISQEETQFWNDLSLKNK